MDREDIIRMAQKVGLMYLDGVYEDALVEFASLVAAAEAAKYEKQSVLLRGFAEEEGIKDKELIKLIESSGATLHGDIEFFAYLIAEREREACAATVERGMGDWRLGKKAAEAIRARGKDA